MSEILTIGAVAGRFGLTLRALRFWEDKGLIAPEREGQARLYGPDQVARVGRIAAFSRAGLTLAEIRLLLRRGPDDLPSDFAPRLAALRQEALARIAAIDALERGRQIGADGNSGVLAVNHDTSRAPEVDASAPSPSIAGAPAVVAEEPAS